MMASRFSFNSFSKTGVRIRLKIDPTILLSCECLFPDNRVKVEQDE